MSSMCTIHIQLTQPQVHVHLYTCICISVLPSLIPRLLGLLNIHVHVHIQEKRGECGMQNNASDITRRAMNIELYATLLLD